MENKKGNLNEIIGERIISGENNKSINFAPSDYTDGRIKLDWIGKYSDPRAKKWILIEAIYLFILVIGLPLMGLLVFLRIPQDYISLSEMQCKIFEKYIYAWIGGAIGGTLFTIKWLYHSIAKEIWHLDRRLWRFFTPLLSGAFGLIMILIISSTIFNVFDRNSLYLPSVPLSVGFISGYFSDMAIAKLMGLAEALFGLSPKTN